MSEAIPITTPVGRLVSGDLFVPETKDRQGNPLLIKSGANMGQPTQKYNIGLAIPKTDPTFNALYAELQRAGREGFPNLFDAAGTCILPTFSDKFTDGDSQVPNSAGNRPCDKAGFPGHWILWFSGSFAPKVYENDEACTPITNPDMVKRGYWIRIVGSVVGNANATKPGVYLNYNLIQLCGFGEVISSGPDAKTAFASPVALPAGASAIPLAPAVAPALPGAPVIPAGIPAVPMQSAGSGVAAAAPAALAPMNAIAPVPAPGIAAPSTLAPPSFTPPAPVAAAPVAPALPGAVAPGPAPGPAMDFLPAPGVVAPVAPVPGVVAPAAVALEPTYTIAGQVITKSALVQLGWTSEQIASQTPNDIPF